MGRRPLELSGMNTGHATVIKRAQNNNNRHSKWLCVCDCGKKFIAYGSHLKSGRTTSCGCFRLKQVIKHGQSDTREYNSWKSAKRRVLNTRNGRWMDYGGRGIRMCDRWLDSFAAFFEDMGPRPPGTSLDRIDNDGDYEPPNCRWATRIEQQNNMRTNVMIGDITMAQYCREQGICDKIFQLYFRGKKLSIEESTTRARRINREV